MLAELSIIPLNRDTQLSDEVAAVVELVAASGLDYRLTPSGTCIEGEWDEVMNVIRQCHSEARERAPHVITMIKIEDEKGAKNQLTSNVRSVQEKVGGNVKTAS